MNRGIRNICMVMIMTIVVAVTGCTSTKAPEAEPAVPYDYVSKVKTGGSIEEKYLALGPYRVSYLEKFAMQEFEKYEIHYPSDIAEGNEKFPVVIFSNGTGIKGSRYTALQEHLASWGFIVLSTEQEFSWSGFSSEMCIRFLMLLDASEAVDGWKTNPFKGNVDFDRIGVSGHSQGGVGAINAATANDHGYLVRTVFAASPANIPLSEALQWEYDPSLITVPTFLVSGTGISDEKLVISGENLKEIYSLIPDDVQKVMARRKKAEHGDMLSHADGYMTAWFMWQLRDDAEAAKAFTDVDGEIFINKLYQDQVSNIR